MVGFSVALCLSIKLTLIRTSGKHSDTLLIYFTFTCSMSTTETAEPNVKPDQNLQDTRTTYYL